MEMHQPYFYKSHYLEHMKIYDQMSGFAANSSIDGTKRLNSGNPGEFSSFQKELNNNAVISEEVYDFTTISGNELHEKVGGLIRTGHIDMDQATSLLGFMGGSPLDKVNFDGARQSSGNERFNALSRIQDSISAALQRNENDSAEGLKRALSALQEFQGKALKDDTSV